MSWLLSILACGDAPSAPAAPAPTPAPAEAKARPSWPPAPAEWAKIPLAEGAIASAQAATEVPPAFRNHAGDIACPVMGMAMKSPDDVVSFADHAGVRYFFCCDACEKMFVGDPEAYADGKYLAAHALDPTDPTCADKE
ncbi:MAG: hypothetical protein ACOZNI_33385 [Myxococcota bacterium]